MIENERPSQAPARNRGEDIEEADEQQQQPRRIKKDKKPAAPPPDEEPTLVGVPPDDEDDPLATLGAQPLDPAQEERIGGLAGDWKQPAENQVSWFEAVNEIAAAFAEFVDDDNEQGKQVRWFNSVFCFEVDCSRKYGSIWIRRTI